MPRSSSDQTPSAYVVSGRWPNASLADGAPLSALYGQAVARKLGDVMRTRDLTLRPLAARTGVAHSTIGRILNGQVLPDIGTLARLESALGASIWPGPVLQAPQEPREPQPTVSSDPIVLPLSTDQLAEMSTEDRAMITNALTVIYTTLARQHY